MAHDLEQTHVFDVNGSKYRVGLDGHGYVQIQPGRWRVDPETGEDVFYPYEREDDVVPNTMLDPATARDVAEYIERLVG